MNNQPYTIMSRKRIRIGGKSYPPFVEHQVVAENGLLTSNAIMYAKQERPHPQTGNLEEVYVVDTRTEAEREGNTPFVAPVDGETPAPTPPPKAAKRGGQSAAAVS